MSRLHCHSCNRVYRTSELYQVDVLVAKATHSSPAEYDAVDICDLCLTAEERDEDYERAERSQAWQQRGGGGL